ncbi:MAG: 50S ribosomal protein L27 [Patescibacteria group bacterium]
MSTHKAAGKARQHKRPSGKRLGAKVATGQKVRAGEVLIRQLGTKVRPGKGTRVSRDFTLYSKVAGTVKFIKKLGKKLITIVS